MTEGKVYVVPDLMTPSPVVFDANVCDGCNTCVEVCMADVLMPNPEKGKPPIVLFPEECFYGACCVKECPLRDEGAIKLVYPLMQRVRWKRKDTGEHFRVGMKYPPPPNTRPPVG